MGVKDSNSKEPRRKEHLATEQLVETMKTSALLLTFVLVLVLMTLPERSQGVLMSLAKRRNEMKYRKVRKAWQKLKTIVNKKEGIEDKMKHIRNWMRRSYKKVRTAFVCHLYFEEPEHKNCHVFCSKTFGFSF